MPNLSFNQEKKEPNIISIAKKRKRNEKQNNMMKFCFKAQS